MLFGAHVSIAGGVQNAPKNAAALGCEVFQMFTRPPQGGPGQKLTEEVIAAFKNERKLYGLKEIAIHTPYYINFASTEERIRKNSSRIIREELERASSLGAEYCVTHLGSASGSGQELALTAVVSGLRSALDGYSGSAQFLIEISAGAGEVIGDTFEEIATILDRLNNPSVGVCFDTQHAFASGYDLRTPETVHETFTKFDRVIGINKLKMSHCNDSKIDLGGRRDRHEHLGEGKIGTEGFRALLAEPLLRRINWYLETEHDRVAEDLQLLKKLRKECVQNP